MSARFVETYLVGIACRIRLFAAYGHNEPKVSVKLIMSLQRMYLLPVKNTVTSKLTSRADADRELVERQAERL